MYSEPDIHNLLRLLSKKIESVVFICLYDKALFLLILFGVRNVFCMTRRTYPQTDYVHPELCTIIGKKTQQPKYFIVVIFNVFLDDLGVI